MAKRKRSALGSSPIDRVLAPPPRSEQTTRQRAEKTRTRSEAIGPRESVRRGSTKRVAHTFRINADVLDQCRAAVVALAGAPVRLTLSDLVESALERELERLKRKHNGGEDFPAYGGTLRAGRPVGS